MYITYVTHVTTSRDVTSRHVTSRHVTSCRVASRRVASRRVASRPVTSRHVTSHHITSHHVLVSSKGGAGGTTSEGLEAEPTGLSGLGTATAACLPNWVRGRSGSSDACGPRGSELRGGALEGQRAGSRFEALGFEVMEISCKKHWLRLQPLPWT